MQIFRISKQNDKIFPDFVFVILGCDMAALR